MKIEEMPAVVHDWPEHARLTEADTLETVKLIYDQPPPVRTPEKSIIDDGARLDTYQARRLNTIGDIIDDIEISLTRANKAREGSDSVSRLDLVVRKLDDAIARLWEARDLLNQFEDV